MKFYGEIDKLEQEIRRFEALLEVDAGSRGVNMMHDDKAEYCVHGNL